MIKIQCDDITKNALGFQCDHCKQTFVWASGAVMHQEKIDQLGLCPDAPEEDEYNDTKEANK